MQHLRIHVMITFSYNFFFVYYYSVSYELTQTWKRAIFKLQAAPKYIDGHQHDPYFSVPVQSLFYNYILVL